MIKRLISLLALLIIATESYSFEIKHIDISSNLVEKQMQATVVLPDSYHSNSDRYITIYVLHGYSGDNNDWVTHSDIAKLADWYNIMLVMPNGDYDKWYIDSPYLSNSHFESYISQDVVATIDKNFRTIDSKQGRGITGLSMGGFGALNIALNHPSQFAAVGSMSGGVDPRSFAKNWGLETVFGDHIKERNYWDEKAIINNAHRFIISDLDIIIDCGTDDFFIDSNRELSKKLTQLNIPHTYTERAGGHTWQYWDEAIKYQILFLTEALKKQ